MDPILVRGLREAKQLLDDGILSAAEFEKEKQDLLRKRDQRVQREQSRARSEDPEERTGGGDGANNTYCSRCGLPGHNKRSCTEDIEALGGKKRRNKVKCDVLGGKRGPSKPRWSRKPTCYALFFGSVTWVQTELKKMKENDADKKLKISDAAKVVAQKWRLLSDEEKIKWKREKEAELGLAGEGSSIGAFASLGGIVVSSVMGGSTTVVPHAGVPPLNGGRPPPDDGGRPPPPPDDPHSPTTAAQLPAK